MERNPRPKSPLPAKKVSPSGLRPRAHPFELPDKDDKTICREFSIGKSEYTLCNNPQSISFIVSILLFLVAVCQTVLATVNEYTHYANIHTDPHFQYCANYLDQWIPIAPVDYCFTEWLGLVRLLNGLGQ